MRDSTLFLHCPAVGGRVKKKLDSRITIHESRFSERARQQNRPIVPLERWPVPKHVVACVLQFLEYTHAALHGGADFQPDAAGEHTPDRRAGPHQVARALAEIAPRFNLAEARLSEIIDGMQMDIDHNHYLTFDALKLYCHRVAGVVGMLSAEIFGYQDRRTLEYAADLGLAFQLTNIIRDVGEDARRDRIYMPLDEIERHGVSLDDIARSRETDGFRRLMEFQIERAQGYYRDAFAKLPAGDRRAQRTGIVMAAIYQTVLDEIRRDGCHVLTRRVSLTPVRKLWIAWWTWVKG